MVALPFPGSVPRAQLTEPADALHEHLRGQAQLSNGLCGHCGVKRTADELVAAPLMLNEC